jgi:hypothetical protein
MQARAQVKATDLTISSAREAKVGKNASVILSENLSIASTGNASKSQVTIDEGAQISVTGDAEIISGNKATLGSNTTVTVTHNLHLEAAKCTVKSSATVTAGSIRDAVQALQPGEPVRCALIAGTGEVVELDI